MNRRSIEFVVGLFVIAGLVAFLYLAMRIGGLEWPDHNHYHLTARFSSASGLKQGAFVELAGVRVGKVSAIDLDPDSYEAVVTIELPKRIRLQEDTIASIRTAGIIGDRYIKLTPGGADDYLADGDEITDTESAINIEELVSKYIFESGGKQTAKR